MERVVQHCLVYVLLLTGVFLDGKEKSEEYSFAALPAEGRINLEQGTIEAWVSLDYSFDKNHLNEKSFVSPMSFFIFEKPKRKGKKQQSSTEEARIELVTEQGRNMKNNVRFICSLAKKKLGKKEVSGWLNFDMADLPWKEKEWHYLAATWQRTGDKYELSLRVDEQHESITLPARELKSGDLKDFVIYIGNFKSAQGAIETLRLSDKARTPAEISESFEKGIVNDEATLLFFDRKSIRKMKKQKSVQFLSQVQLNKRGTFVGPSKTIKSKHGKAIQFHK